jgi:hypothetical protein
LQSEKSTTHGTSLSKIFYPHSMKCQNVFGSPGRERLHILVRSKAHYKIGYSQLHLCEYYETGFVEIIAGTGSGIANFLYIRKRPFKGS